MEEVKSGKVVEIEGGSMTKRKTEIKEGMKKRKKQRVIKKERDKIVGKNETEKKRKK